MASSTPGGSRDMAPDQTPSETTPAPRTDPDPRPSDDVEPVSDPDPSTRRRVDEADRVPDADTTTHRPVDDAEPARATDADTTHRPVGTADRVPDADTTHRPVDTAYLIKQQKAQFGGMKIGACFFGWLTAAGTAVILTAAAAVILGVIGMELAPNALDPNTVGMATAIALIAGVFVAYLAGGYVAGRMARFNGMKQGIGVWLWAIIIAVVAVILGVVAGQQFDLSGQAIGLPQVSFDPTTMTTRGTVTVLVVLGTSLIGAIIGGLAGMRYHRRIDRRTDLTDA